ncbi:hypothetical protein AcdelDRAFT_4567 [Acidovorax delafieldii 2AN]|uniref:Transmembrane protein n=1 Tax=Acidovorax delafieldii 2AN TaxID=573060 RepID=C5TCD6_ACIDE|nr:hypothetical protein [Acidovorax delafieldii]EER57863.1 hypothetical protein AcdelDRAFT_4567 [Acidovorax delafieldii 2AN]
MQTTRRILVVALCYLLSSYGILMSLVLAGKSVIAPSGVAGIGLLILLAWVFHLVMSVHWIADSPAQRWVPLAGICTGTLGLVLWPAEQTTLWPFSITDALRAFALGGVMTLPCVALAIYLVRFHLTRRPARTAPPCR